MKVLILGAGGMLGHKLAQVFQKELDVWATVRSVSRFDERIYGNTNIVENINVENIETVERAVGEIKPGVIINAVGIIKQLPTAKNVIKTLRVNSIFPHQLAETANAHGARLITISTDCVFNGKKGKYVETDVPDAEDLYGKSKNLGEVSAENCLTLRTSIIGRELNTAHSLIEWFLSNAGKTVKGYTNAIYSGFPTVIMAEIIRNLIVNHPTLEGLFHVSSEPISKFDLLNLANAAYETKVNIEPSDDYRIDRSLDSTKFRQATGFVPPEWGEMIKRMAADNAVYKNYKNK